MYLDSFAIRRLTRSLLAKTIVLLLQVLLEPVGNLAQEMIASVASKDAVIAVGIPYFLEVLVCLYQSLGILVSILWMHIVICHAMTNQQGSMQLIGTLYRLTNLPSQYFLLEI